MPILIIMALSMAATRSTGMDAERNEMAMMRKRLIAKVKVTF